MQHGACTRLLGVHFVKGAGHSVVEEQPAEVNRLVVEFLRSPTALRGAAVRTSHGPRATTSNCCTSGSNSSR
jgi:hypothetical protein